MIVHAKHMEKCSTGRYGWYVSMERITRAERYAVRREYRRLRELGADKGISRNAARQVGNDLRASREGQETQLRNG